ncbi:MAG TPA: Asp-tRNA(Asn)/Glu-tRNA(Gln) amidotransferase subunit GatC [Candidatus Sumerlaeota bacterium]|nr:Asp-tRNA(Asn)/Glu-tRNA(Gln) amidotransferase subunit GatC [Candidatus Sumerlaeota bacterium]HMX62231.1 Asp-tRNA(Asn)/Glu-tRNA(Gln) amidotransferase subunit GatC [Candidatus Sumerlaeota bacterium]HMZ51001.1 Asp-tRNA(Asn)/Glu-tRNA(Gln) amidotransferase subunit GatC [Candidatus Sumerlaeota bacterium]HNM45382.1 Asp-tRNA(Asn)/Glu-tRNA(Gln) amidotransferase subunit GatC [Candidatus Sumerlaeota bacterium]
MAITIADVEHVALLSRLEISAEEKERFAQELSDIFGHVEELNKVDVSGVPPTAHPLPMKNVFREDVVKPSLPNAEALANAPAKEGPLFKVPQIV